MAKAQSKIPLASHEVMLMIGAVDPKVSSRLKSALDHELAKPEYQEMPNQTAWILACRHVAVTDPTAFDPENPDDLAVQKLFPLMFGETGLPNPPATVFSKLNMKTVAVTHEVRGEEIRLAITSSDKKGPPKTARFKAKLKPGAKDLPDLPDFGLHTYRGPV